MAYQTTYTNAREHFAELMDRAVDDRETVIIQRRGHEDVALIAASELTGLLETAHLLRSPKNRKRLLAALESAQRGTGERITPEELRKEFGLGKKA